MCLLYEDTLVRKPLTRYRTRNSRSSGCHAMSHKEEAAGAASADGALVAAASAAAAALPDGGGTAAAEKRKKRRKDPYKLTRNEDNADEEDEVSNIAAVTVFPTGPASCNCALLLDRDTGDLVVVNPGGDFEKIVAELKTLVAQTSLKRVKLAYILVAQAHTFMFLAAPHVLALGNGAGELCLHERDEVLWQRAVQQAHDLEFEDQLPPAGFPDPTLLLTHQQELRAGHMRIRCLHTPGVTPGATCFYFPQLNIVFTGTTLLSESVGRTSWLGIPSLDGTASSRRLRRSIDDVLMAEVPGDAKVVPGFGPLTSLRHELHNNMHLKKLSKRWESYDEAQELKRRAEAKRQHLLEDPHGDGLPF